MTLAAHLERLMGMDDAVWLRHANPLSGWTRMPILPLLALAIWSRVWIGGVAWIIVGLICVWIWLNPRVFPVPERFDAWMSRGVLGEWVYLRHRASLPAHHLRATRMLEWASLPGVLVMIWGLWSLDAQAAIFGTVLSMGPKLWFLDRMVWILQDWRHAGGDVLGLPEGEFDV